MLGTSFSPLLQSSGTPAFLTHVQQLEMLTHCSASCMSLISFRPSHPRGVYHDGLAQQSLCASGTVKILINSGLLCGNTIGFYAQGSGSEKDMKTKAEQQELTEVSE